MKLSMDPINLNYFEALASHTRLRVIQLLSERDRNIKELAEALDVSSSIMTKHVRKLESAGLITTSNLSRDGNRHKVCSLLNVITEVLPPFQNDQIDADRRFYETALPVGMFSDIHAATPCGMADTARILGCTDQPAYLLGGDRAAAELLWLRAGYVEYLLPQYLQEQEWLTAIEFSGEFGSIATGSGQAQSSAIRMSLNGSPVCSFTVPGDTASLPGTLTPAWWSQKQYGFLVVVTIDENGVFVNGEKKSARTVDEWDPIGDRWTLRFDVEEAGRYGGMTLFGEQFGNYGQALLFRTYYDG